MSLCGKELDCTLRDSILLSLCEIDVFEITAKSERDTDDVLFEASVHVVDCSCEVGVCEAYRSFSHRKKGCFGR